MLEGHNNTSSVPWYIASFLIRFDRNAESLKVMGCIPRLQATKITTIRCQDRRTRIKNNGQKHYIWQNRKTKQIQPPT